MQVLENKPSTTFWASLGRSLEKHARDAAKGMSGDTCSYSSPHSSIRVELPSTNSQHGISEVAPPVPFVFHQDRRAHGYGVHSDSAEVSLHLFLIVRA